MNQPTVEWICKMIITRGWYWDSPCEWVGEGCCVVVTVPTPQTKETA